ncbi:S-adenosylmethionine uptake transporter [Polymorphobacter multimanifer]|uniref:S-adenosylmethionine uptake transporter n=1 Tax=Polymorphobacter multimanifer TaxID=1070431 RepID=A0A841L0G9_9SPHN|nr:DMT family transporter [Polymorphobacter multimanifer]MBB6225900.1 S-adenosylmethionine uptake transporter [Polymorphobacter multimanifer]
MLPSPRSTTALLQCVAGIGALTAMDALVKWLAQSNAVEVVTLGRYASGAAIALMVWQIQRRPSIGVGTMKLHFLRGFLITITALSFFYAIDNLPLAEALTIAFVAPLLVPPLARLVLHERMRRQALLAGLIGFAGVLISVQGAPDGGDARMLAVAAALFAAVTYAATAVLLRSLAATNGATAITLLGSLIPLLLLSPVALLHPLPDSTSLVGFAALGLIGNIGMQLLARAYASLEAQMGAVMEFTALPWAALFGFFIFGDAVRVQTWAGAAVILVAVLIAARPEADLKPADPQSSP